MAKRALVFSFLCVVTLITGPTWAQMDVTVSRMPGIEKNATVGDVTAYSLASTSCNIGDQVAIWIATSNQHPVIAGNVYRIDDEGLLSQIGQSWLKHSFCAVNEFSCGNCQETPCATLGIGCADTYGTFLNGEQTNLGPRSDVNPSTGEFTYPFPTQGEAPPDGIHKRCQIHNDDLDPALNPGAQYFGTVQYITPDEPAFDRHHNNNAYRPLGVGQLINGGWQLFYTGETEWPKSPIEAWSELVGIENPVDIDVISTPENAGSGTLVVGTRVIDLQNGWFRYQYAVFNNTSDRSARSFSIPFPAGIAVENIQFHDVDYHSGEPFVGDDWSKAEGGGALTWSTQTFDENVNANALRWGTTYSFAFDAEAPPVPVLGTIGLFKPGDGDSVNFETVGPATEFTEAVNDLSCFFAVQGAQLTWQNGESYSEIQISRDDVLIDTIPGTSSAYSDTTAAPGEHQYAVAGVANDLASFPRFCSTEIPEPSALIFHFDTFDQTVPYDSATGTGSFTANLSLVEDSGNADYPNNIAGFSISISHDSDLLAPTGVRMGVVLEALNGGDGPDFFEEALYPDGVTLGVIFTIGGAGYINADYEQTVARIDYELNSATLAGNTTGATTLLLFENGIAAGVFNSVVIEGGADFSADPGFGYIDLVPGGQDFSRGDADGDGEIDINDALYDLNYQFLQGPSVCLKAHDSDDNGTVSIGDPLITLAFLFQDGPPPAAPHPTCGADPTPDSLTCDGPVTCP